MGSLLLRKQIRGEEGIGVLLEKASDGAAWPPRGARPNTDARPHCTTAPACRQAARIPDSARSQEPITEDRSPLRWPAKHGRRMTV